MIYTWKHGNAPKVGQNKPKLLAACNATKNTIEDNKPWKTEDQSELEKLDTEILQICDT